jgi:1-acyl-sn-glycerol-3-phosphate acyltransferase
MVLFRLLKLPARIAIKIYCTRLHINAPCYLKSKGPLLLAMNHPNSFLDAVIITTIFDQPVYSLARGDAFSHKWSAKLLSQLNIFPVYRRTEGVENLEANYETFELCKNVFREKGIVLIFSEGRCINEWKLRPLKKGTARLALSSWEENIDLKVLPVGINYDSFRSFGKSVVLNFGNPLDASVISGSQSFGQAVMKFNSDLESQLKDLVISGAHAARHIHSSFEKNIPGWKKNLLSPFALIGYFLNAPLYLPVRSISLKKAAPFEHYDSVMVGLLFILYPFYLFLIFLLVWLITSNAWIGLAMIFLLPFSAWSFLRLNHKKNPR